MPLSRKPFVDFLAELVVKVEAGCSGPIHQPGGRYQLKAQQYQWNLAIS
jgi:hypothetical protein